MTTGYANFRPPRPPPPPPVGRIWFWLALGLSIAGLTVTAVGLAIVIAVSESDNTNHLENSKILDVVKSECADLRLIMSHFPIEGPSGLQAEAIEAQNHAIDHLVQAVRALDSALLRSDEPARAWTDDWERLLKARSDYAESLRIGAPADMAQPTDGHGHSIFNRMNDASSPECRIPKSLFEPYPREPGETI